MTKAGCESRIELIGERDDPLARLSHLPEALLRRPPLGRIVPRQVREVIDAIRALGERGTLPIPFDRGEVFRLLAYRTPGTEPRQRVFDAVRLGDREDLTSDHLTEDLLEQRHGELGVLEEIVKDREDDVHPCRISILDEDESHASQVFEVARSVVPSLVLVPLLGDVVRPLDQETLPLSHGGNEVKERPPIHRVCHDLYTPLSCVH